jgi:hypothetical protein
MTGVKALHIQAINKFLDKRYQEAKIDHVCLIVNLAAHRGEGGLIYPSRKTLAKELRVSERKVWNLLDQLRKREILSWDSGGLVGKHRLSNHYHFCEELEWAIGNPKNYISSLPDNGERIPPKISRQLNPAIRRQVGSRISRQHIAHKGIDLEDKQPQRPPNTGIPASASPTLIGNPTVSPERFEAIRTHLLEMCGSHEPQWTRKDSALTREFGVKTADWQDCQVLTLLDAVYLMTQAAEPWRILEVALLRLRGDMLPGFLDVEFPDPSSASPPRRSRRPA